MRCCRLALGKLVVKGKEFVERNERVERSKKFKSWGEGGEVDRDARTLEAKFCKLAATICGQPYIIHFDWPHSAHWDFHIHQTSCRTSRRTFFFARSLILSDHQRFNCQRPSRPTTQSRCLPRRPPVPRRRTSPWVLRPVRVCAIRSPIKPVSCAVSFMTDEPLHLHRRARFRRCSYLRLLQRHLRPRHRSQVRQPLK